MFKWGYLWTLEILQYSLLNKQYLFLHWVTKHTCSSRGYKTKGGQCFTPVSGTLTGSCQNFFRLPTLISRSFEAPLPVRMYSILFESSNQEPIALFKVCFLVSKCPHNFQYYLYINQFVGIQTSYIKLY